MPVSIFEAQIPGASSQGARGTSSCIKIQTMTMPSQQAYRSRRRRAAILRKDKALMQAHSAKIKSSWVLCERTSEVDAWKDSFAALEREESRDIDVLKAELSAFESEGDCKDFPIDDHLNTPAYTAEDVERAFDKGT